MFNIMKNAARILLKRKSFIISSFLMPVALIFLFALMYAGNSKLKIGVINNDKGEFGKVIEERLESVEIEVVELEKDVNYETKLVFHEVEMVINIEEDFTEKLLKGEKSDIKVSSISNGDMEPTIMAVMENETQSLAKLCNNIDVNESNIDDVIKTFNESKPAFEFNEVEVAQGSINDNLGIIIYLIFIVAGMSCSFLVEDSRGKTKDRILMGNVKEKDYYGGLGLVFVILTSIPVIEYYVVNELIGTKFGFENHILLPILMFFMVLVAVAFNIMLSSIIKKKNVMNLVNSAFMIPMFMLSGSFWPFEVMSDSLQKVGNTLPPRWLYLAIENLQAGKDIGSIIPMVLGLLAFAVLLFLLSIFFTKHKIVLVKED
ncbi:MAG: ABC transporter permease [Clostridium sp.]